MTIKQDKAYYERWRRSKGAKPREEWLSEVRKFSGESKWCPDCKSEKPLHEFNKASSRPSGYQSVCRRCQSGRHQDWHARAKADPEKADHIRNTNRGASRKKRGKPGYKIQVHAWRIVQSTILSGDLIRQPCEVCGAEPTEAHHEDYYKPLEVNWLCKKHHKGHHTT